MTAKALKKILPLFVFISIASLIALLWHDSRRHHEEMLASHVRSSLERSAIRLNEDIRTRFLTLTMLALHLRDHLRAGDFNGSLFRMTVQPAFATLAGFQAINWIEPDGTISVVYPREGNSTAAGKNLTTHPEKAVREAFRSARESRAFTITPLVQLYQGGVAVATYAPVTDAAGEIKGYMNGVLKILPMIESAVQKESDCDFSILQNGVVLFTSQHVSGKSDEGSSREAEAAFQEAGAETTVNESGLSFTLRMWPTRGIFDLYRGMHYLWLSLAGMVMALALSYAVFRLQRRYDLLREKDRELQESESKFRSLVEHSLAGIYLVQDGMFKYVNPKFCAVTGYGASEIIDRLGPRDLVYPADWPLVEENLRKRLDNEIQAVNYTFRGVRKNGELVDAEAYGARTLYNGRAAIIGMLVDITEKKRLEEQLRQSQKLESVGLLAGGIAHDFNNILTAISGYASLLTMSLRDETMKGQARLILRSSERAASLTQSLLAFSRKQVIQPMPIHLGTALKDFEQVLRRVLPENIEIKIISRDRQQVMADPGQMEQVIMNLATNARDAMPDGGKLTIETADARFDERYSEQQPWMNVDTPLVCLSVADTGLGMDRDVQEHAFDPFFTTKEVGKGTGLGLSTVYGIVSQHNGFILIDSEKGKGTTFSIYLPATDAAPRCIRETAGAGDRVPGGSETILLAEDDENVRHIAEEALIGQGYSVVIARDGEEALRALQKMSGRIDLLVLDAIMPKKGGKEVYESARSRGYDGAVLFISGYTGESLHNNYFADNGLRLLPKPFTPSLLLRTVREALDKTPHKKER